MAKFLGLLKLFSRKNHAQDPGHVDQKHGVLSQLSGNSAKEYELPLLNSLSDGRNLFPCPILLFIFNLMFQSLDTSDKFVLAND